MPTGTIAIAVLLSLGMLPRAGLAAGADGPRIEHGRALLAQYQCGTCHAIPGVQAAKGNVAQPLAGWRNRSYIAGLLPNSADVLARWIAAPQALVPGTPMPSMGVSPADAQAMAAYLLSLE